MSYEAKKNAARAARQDRCAHDLIRSQCAPCTNPDSVRALDRLSRTAMATEGYHDLRKEDRA